MPITMSGATIETSERESLLSSEVDTSIVSGGVAANTHATGPFSFIGIGAQEATGAPLAGVTAEFASHVTTEIDNYKTAIQTELDKLTTVESNGAFKGEAINTALSKFIDAVRETGTQYIERLSAAETQIINSVNAAYQTQDTDLSGNLNSDAGSLQR